MNRDQARHEASQILDGWKRVTYSDPLVEYTSGDYRIQGRGSFVGNKLFRSWYLLRNGQRIASPNRLTEAKEAAVFDLADRIVAGHERYPDDEQARAAFIEDRPKPSDVVTIKMSLSQAEALAEAAMLGYSAMRKAQRTDFLAQARDLLSDSITTARFPK